MISIMYFTLNARISQNVNCQGINLKFYDRIPLMETSLTLAVLLSALAGLFFARCLQLKRLLKEKQLFLKQCSSLIKSGAFSEADDLLSGPGIKFPNDPGLSYLSGYARYRLNRPAEALQLFLAAEKNGDPRAFYSSGYLYFHNEEDPGAAMPRLEKAAKSRTAGLQAGYTLGLLHYVMGNTKKAERIILKTLAAGAVNEAAIDNALGLISMKENDPSGAVLRFKASIHQNDAEPDTYLNLAEAHAARREPAMELAMLEKAESLHPGNKYIRLKLGEVLASRGKHEEALVHLSAALELDKAFSLAYFARAKVYRKLGNDDKCRGDYENALSCGRS